MAELSSLSMPMWRIEVWREKIFNGNAVEEGDWCVSGIMSTATFPGMRTVTYAKCVELFKAAKTNEGVTKNLVYRLHNIRTGDVVMAAIL